MLMLVVLCSMVKNDVEHRFGRGFREWLFLASRGGRILKDIRALIICNDGARKMTVAYLK